MDSSFFQPVGPGWPRLVGPVGGEMAGFRNPPLDPAMQLRINMKGTSRERDVRHKVTWSRAMKNKLMEQKAEIPRARPRDHMSPRPSLLRAEKELGKPKSPRSLEHGDAFDALEYSSQKYLLGDGAENKSPRNLARAQGRIEYMKTGNEVNEAFGGLENIFTAELEPSPGESVAQVKPKPVE